MLFTPIVIALTAWQSLASATDVPNDGQKDGCISALQLEAVADTLTQIQVDVEESERIVLPAIPKKYTCLPSSISDPYVENVIRLAKDQNLVEKFEKQLRTPPPGRHTTQARDLTHSLDKRIRSCPEMKQSAIDYQKIWSCDAAQNPDHCRSCSGHIATNLIFACVACAAKMNYEAPFCCVAAASVFVTAYTQVCLTK
ncbi:hypothetical protein E4U21_004629 [Claviceps maximensis]|nr:hypothetical protein E4U21_004629 [Claviceps maximensis]